MADLLSIQDEITAKLKELPQEVYETAVPDDVKIPHGSNGLFLPYIVIYFQMFKKPQPGKASFLHDSI